MLRQVIFATAPPRKNSREFLRNKEQSHSVQANRFICLRLSVAHCDVVQGPGATELPGLLPTLASKVGRGRRVAPHPAYEFKSAAFKIKTALFHKTDGQCQPIIKDFLICNKTAHRYSNAFYKAIPNVLLNSGNFAAHPSFRCRCFLPDLTGFTDTDCTRPKLQRSTIRRTLYKENPPNGIQSCCGGLQVTGHRRLPT